MTQALHFGSDTTERWSVRGGDLLVWVRCVSPFAPPANAFTILDVWELRDGDHLLLTNRACDLPEALHDPDLDEPGVWRLRTSDRVAWVGRRGPGRDPV